MPRQVGTMIVRETRDARRICKEVERLLTAGDREAASGRRQDLYEATLRCINRRIKKSRMRRGFLDEHYDDDVVRDFVSDIRNLVHTTLKAARLSINW